MKILIAKNYDFPLISFLIIQNANLTNCHDRTNSTYRKFLTKYKHERDVNHIYSYRTIAIKEFIYPFLFLYSLRLYFLCSILYLYSLEENTKNTIYIPPLPYYT